MINLHLLSLASSTAKMGANSQCEQFDHADPDHQHRECYGIVVEPRPPFTRMIGLPYTHSVGLAGRKVQSAEIIESH
jgi:hypothetical protein